MIRHKYIGTSFMHLVELKLGLEELVQFDRKDYTQNC